MALTMSRGFPYALQKASSSVRNNHSHFTNGGKNLYITFVNLMRTHTQTLNLHTSKRPVLAENQAFKVP